VIFALQFCKERDLSFQHLFVRQYCLSKNPLPRVADWKQPNRLLDWGLTHCPKLECRSLKDRSGRPLGWLLGTAIDQDGNVIKSSKAYTLPIDSASANFWEDLETDISRLAGKYIAFVITPQGKRVYFDPVMDLPAVYNAKEKLVGTSPLITLTHPMKINHRANHKWIIKEGGNYGMQQTCDPDVQRALSNHYLDLDSFALHRHWPNSDETFDRQPGSLQDTAEFIVARLGQITGALLENYSCAVPLSGGADSRTLAFSAKSKLQLAKACFSHRTNWITGIDCYLATQMANVLGVGLQIIDAVDVIRNQAISPDHVRKLRWDFCHRTGYQNAPSNTELVASDLIPEADFVIRGNIMDMTRANQWPRSFKFSIGHAISKLAIGGRPTEENLNYWAPEYKNWLTTVPTHARARAYEFAFVEHLLPNTLGARLMGYNKASYINPFNDRSLIKACMQVSPESRKSGELQKAIYVACDAPDIPFVADVKSNDDLKAKAAQLFE